MTLTEARCEVLLDNWARWMRLPTRDVRWYPARASGGIECYTSNMEFDAECDKMDNRDAFVTDTVIQDLKPDFRLAVHAQLLGGKWHLPLIALGIYFRDAAQQIARALDRKGIE